MLDSVKPGLYIALGVILFMMWTTWQKEHGSEHALPRAVAQQSLDVPSISINDAHSQVAESTMHHPVTAAHHFVQVDTDKFTAYINLHGGSIERLTLKDYPVSLQQQDKYIELLNNTPGHYYVAQSGLASSVGPDDSDGPAKYSAERKAYTLANNENEIKVTLAWQNQDGLMLNKIFTFHRDSYLIAVTHRLVNQTQQLWSGKFYAQIKRNKAKKEKTGGFFSFPTYTGAAISTPEKRFEKVSFDDMLDSPVKRQDVTGGWVAMIQHYFLSAWLPAENEAFDFSSVADANQNYYWIRMVGPALTAKPGGQVETTARFYAGPEITSRLSEIAPGLELTIDYGIFSPISQGLFWLLKQLHTILGNWGLAIIAVTVLIKLAFYKLSAASYRSMANMRRIQPKLTSLKERYGDDKQKMSQAMIDLYKNEKINPLGGCLPILIQIPVFIALYWVLIESVELRQAPFYLWIQDLSAKDPFFVLPVIMGITMFLQQRLSPAPPDPMQAKVMMAMPILFTGLFMYFPAGLLLYWVVNNSLSILQQWAVMRQTDNASKRK